ncbi:hypothetical protein SELMODRAFT_438381 [Selaginella moellendorffii]|uniref:Uncharacterized protein n=1 Tax=Selaginella moellendorffii TaxID=88036 RepID=D8QXJ6_SELML|nr:chitinase-like protein PB1E7.04c [Selaginella moellendorffii]EFJ35433.1 hypothetical protein SELMODRAFT_438381 [Selaginella moellendorffii]|eukprot:XP_002963562.1 chitinase-like protein PB1E7.04c [Selaginella moellendorffii]
MDADKNSGWECGKANAADVERPDGSNPSSDSACSGSDASPRPAADSGFVAISLSSSSLDAAASSSNSEKFSSEEVATLARCLCAPLVSIRVGRIVSHGYFLRPTNSRGHLDLTMLPSSDLRLSFLGDDGTIERLALVSSSPIQGSFPVELQEIATDSSGRSFVLKLASNRSVFFWQSEKSKARGDELVLKMKDILQQRPTLCQQTGIHESRLKSIASGLQTLPPSSSSSFPSGPEALLPGSLPLPSLSNPFVCSSEGDDAPSAVCSQALAAAAIGMSFGLASSTSTTVPGSSSIAATLFSLNQSQRLLRSSGELDKKAFAQRILGSLPQTFVPFPLLVSGSVSVPSVPLSAVVAPYYCPCPLGAASALQYSTFTSHLPSLVSSSAAASFVSVGPPPPLLPPLGFSLPLVSPASGVSLASGPLMGVVLPCPLKPESPSTGVFQGGLADILGVYSSSFLPTSVDLGRNFSSSGLTNLYCQPALENNSSSSSSGGMIWSSNLSHAQASSSDDLSSLESPSPDSSQISSELSAQPSLKDTSEKRSHSK